MRKSVAGVVALALGVFSVLPAGAQDQSGRAPDYVLAGYMSGIIRSGQTNGHSKVRYTTLGAHAGWGLRGWDYAHGGRLDVVAEPFLGVAFEPDPDVEIAVPIMLRYRYALGPERAFAFYLELGVGPIYLSRNFVEQSTYVNFVDIGGIGFIWRLSETLAIQAGGRVRHVSNASLSRPNRGIDLGGGVVGLTWQY